MIVGGRGGRVRRGRGRREGEREVGKGEGGIYCFQIRFCFVMTVGEKERGVRQIDMYSRVECGIFF